MCIEACVQSPLFKNPIQAIFDLRTYREGLNHLQFGCQKSTSKPLTLIDRIKHIAYGLCLLIPIINAIVPFILKKLYAKALLKTFLPISTTIASTMTGIKTEYFLPAILSLSTSYHLARRRQYQFALAFTLNSALMTIHSTMGLFLPRDVKLLGKINRAQPIF